MKINVKEINFKKVSFTHDDIINHDHMKIRKMRNNHINFEYNEAEALE